MGTRKELKVGDLVRIGRCYEHGLRFGVVTEFVEYSPLGTAVVLAPWGLFDKPSKWAVGTQWVGLSNITLAKQAMKARAQYKNRR